MNDLASIPLLQAVGWTLLHSLWEGAVLALLAALALRLARHRSAELRHTIASWSLALLLLGSVLTLVWVYRGHDPVSTFGALTIAPLFDGKAESAWLPRLHMALGPWIPWLFAGWVLGFTFKLVQLGRAMAWLYGPCLGSIEPPPARWLARFESLQQRMKIGRSVRLGLSDQVDSLMALGWLKPVVLIPTSALLSLTPEALEAVLIHELEHVRRGDFLANVLQTFAEALLFYHPAVWWLSRRIRQEREHACDDAAVQACGDPILYASALARLEELRAHAYPIPDLAPAASGGRLMSRIQRLLRPRAISGFASPAAAFIPAFLLVAAMGAAALSARPATETIPQEPVKTSSADPLGGDATVEIITKAPEGPQSAKKPASRTSEPVEMEFNRIRITKQPIPPAYPAAAKEARIQGTVVVVITIDEEGKVSGAKAISGPEELHECAVDYAKAWTFKPAMVKGKPVAARFKLTMPFRLR